jgi:hypothetical protein
MKKLTKISMVVLLTFFFVQSNAQTFGIKVGLNLSKFLIKIDDETYSDEHKMNPGFHIGATADFAFNNLLSFETGLLLTTKGTKTEEGGLKQKINLLYLDIPLTIKAGYAINDGLTIFGQAGPYIGIGLSGKYKWDSGTDSGEEDFEWGNDAENDNFKRLDYGLTFGAGVEISKISIGISYDLGLANISTVTDDGYTEKNRVLKFSLGYSF